MFFALIIRCYLCVLFFLIAFESRVFAEVFNQQENLMYVIVPGQLGRGGEHVEDAKIIHPSTSSHVIRTQTPLEVPFAPFLWYADFGQDRCQAYLKSVLNPLLEAEHVHSVILHGSSQGTASIINYLATLQDKKMRDKIKAVILESALASGNSAIYHCVTQTFKCMGMSYGRFLGSLPLSKYWIPFLARFVFPFYSPAGLQPIHHIEKLPQELPIIILHSTKDKILPYDAAVGLYTRLRSTGHEHAYFIQSHRKLHIDLLNQNIQPNEQAGAIQVICDEIQTNSELINAIFKKHELPYAAVWGDKKVVPDLSIAQPKFVDAAYLQYSKIERVFSRLSDMYNSALMNKHWTIIGVMLGAVSMLDAKNF